MYSDFSHHKGGVYPCPRCNQLALYQRKPDIFRCIGCGFRRNLADNHSGLAPLAMAIMILIFLVVLF